MYLYLYAPFLREKKYASPLALLEGRINDFGIQGKIAQLSQFLKFPAALKEFGLKRLSTLVVVGDDSLLEEAVSVANGTPGLVIGYIPMVQSNYGATLGIPQGPEAVDILAARRITKFDLGRIGERCFFGSLKAEGVGLEFHCPTFSVFPKEYAKLEIVNLGFFLETGEPSSDATDGLLEVSIVPFRGTMFRKAESATHIKTVSCRLKASKPVTVTCSGLGTLKLPLQVDIIPKAIRMVVGRSKVARK
ncbi:MAG: hypothetical protein Q7S48_00745 [bacterium]|nr:hypothetical protein [bacterium]